MSQKLPIKNMVCPRCIATVEQLFRQEQIPVRYVKLGEVETVDKLDEQQLRTIEQELKTRGFELLKDHNAVLISKIKSIIIDQVHHHDERLHINFSTLLSGQLHHDYSALSKLFSSVEGITIERYLVKQRIEKVKELLFYNQLTLSEIAFRMSYSSAAHLSAQFKKETGMTPSEFRKMRKPGHQPLDLI